MLEAGNRAPRKYNVSIEQKERKSVKWKEELEKILGIEKIKKIVIRTKPTITKKLIIF